MEYETTSTLAGFLMSHDAPPIAAPLIADSPPSALPGERRTFDDALGRRIVDLHVWAVHEGLRGATAYELFDGFCQRLVAAGVPLWRGFAGTQTIHPQWTGYGYLWRRDLNAIQPNPFVRGGLVEPDWLDSPFRHLVDRPRRRRRGDAGALDALNATRAASGKPVAAVDLALHLDEVLCETLGRKVLVSSALAAAAEGSSARLEPLGRHTLRGVREAREIFALAL
jgi:hypothetical protein